MDRRIKSRDDDIKGCDVTTRASALYATSTLSSCHGSTMASIPLR
jgi:hypothetical protein